MGGILESGCADLVVRYCTIIGNKSESIYIGHYNYLPDTITGVIVEYNTIQGAGGSEGDIDIKPGCYGAIVRYNTHYQGGSGKACGVVIQANATQVYGNKFYTMAASSDWGNGIALHAEGDAEGNGKEITSALIYNNLLYT